MFDPHGNLVRVTVTVAPTTPTAGTTLKISDADAAILDAAGLTPVTTVGSEVAFNAVVHPFPNSNPDATSEIIRFTAKGASSGGNTQYTITRQAETGGINRSIVVGDKITITATKKTFTDLERLSYTPQGYLINGKIVTSVASNNLTIAIKGKNGSDPSLTNPVGVMIGNTLRIITAALSVTVAAGGSYFGAGSTDLATQEIDYFTYLVWNTALGTPAVSIGVSRIPYGRIVSNFSAISTNDNHLWLSNGANTNDEVENIGRFNAINSGTPSYNWSIPATSIIINHPILETRTLMYIPTVTGFTAANTTACYYQIFGSQCRVDLELNGTSNSGTFNINAPITPAATISGNFGVYLVGCLDNGAFLADPSILGIAADIVMHVGKTIGTQAANTFAGFTAAGAKQINAKGIVFQLKN